MSFYEFTETVFGAELLAELPADERAVCVLAVFLLLLIFLRSVFVNTGRLLR